MKRTWLGTLGLVGAGLTSILVGQAVRGQPELPRVVEMPPATARPLEGPNLNGLTPPPVPAASIIEPAAPAPTGPVTQVQFSSPALPEKAPEVPAAEARSGRQEPAVSVEWVGPATARLHHPVACQIVVRNTSAVGVHNVVVRHRLADGVQLRASEPAPSSEGGELAWALGSLAAGQTKKVDLQLVSENRGPVNCQASVTFTAHAGHQLTVREPLLAVKLKAPDKVIAGEPVTLAFAVTNPGDGTTDGVKVKALLPEGLEHSRGRVLEVEVGSIAPKETRNLQLVCHARGTGMQKCQVVVTCDGNLNARDAADVEILLPKLDVAVNGPKLRYIDRHAVYQLKVSNPGSAPATGVALHEAIPAGFKFHSASAGGRYDEATRTVAWTLGDLPPGQNREVTLDLIATKAGEQRLMALVSSARGLKTGTETLTHIEGLASLSIELADVDDPVEVGAETAYELRVTNTGTKTESNLEVACTLPEQVELRGVKCSADLKYRVEGRELIFEPLPRLALKADVIYRLQVRGKVAGDARLRVRVRADDLRDPVVREESTRFYSDDTPVRPTATPPESR